MWAGDDKCSHIIDRVWSNDEDRGSMEGVLRLMKRCGEHFSEWNKHSFGNVFRKLDFAKKNLQQAQDGDSLQLDGMGVTKPRQELQLWLERDDVIWG